MPTILTINTASDTFSSAWSKTNEAITELNTVVLKVNAAAITGNVAVNGAAILTGLHIWGESGNANSAKLTITSSLLTNNVNTVFTGANLMIQASNVAISANVRITGSSLSATGTLSITGDITGNSNLSIIGTATFSNTVNMTGNVVLGSSLTWGGPLLAANTLGLSPSLTANVNDWAPAGHSNAMLIRISPDGNHYISGIHTPVTTAYRMLYLFNISDAYTITIPHNSTDSTETYRVMGANSANTVIRPNGGICLWYDRSSTRWRVVQP
jgi:hypothetical protein